MPTFKLRTTEVLHYFDQAVKTDSVLSLNELHDCCTTIPEHSKVQIVDGGTQVEIADGVWWSIPSKYVELVGRLEVPVLSQDSVARDKLRRYLKVRLYRAVPGKNMYLYDFSFPVTEQEKKFAVLEEARARGVFSCYATPVASAGAEYSIPFPLVRE